MDSLPPPPPATSMSAEAGAAAPAPPPSTRPSDEAYGYAAGDIYPRGSRERELCARASHVDWMYLGGLAVLDAGAIWFGSWDKVKYAGDKDAGSVFLRWSGPATIGITWGATVGGAWLALPKCSPEWVGEASPKAAQARWPIALSLALLAGATAPIVNGIAIGSNLPLEWSDLERAMHAVTAGLAGFAGALLPYVLPPRTLSAAREIERIRFGVDSRGATFLGYVTQF